MKFCHCILFLIAQTAAGCALTPITPPSIGLSMWAIAGYALLSIAIWQVVLRDWSVTLLLKILKRETLPTVASVIISAAVFLFVFGLLFLVIIIPENTLFIMGVLTFFMAPLAGTMLVHRLNCSWRNMIIRAVLLMLVVVSAGWIWTATMDNGIEEFFGQGSVLSRFAEHEIRAPGYDDPIPPDAFRIRKWRVSSIENNGNGYCMHIQSYGWMRAPVQPTGEWPSGWIHCFDITISNEPFLPKAVGAGVGVDGIDVLHFRGTLDRGTKLQGMAWRNGILTLTLSPYNSLTGLVLEIIDKGDVILTLLPSDSTTDKEAGTLTWAVEDQPWEVGDSLTFRIRAQRLPPAPP